MIAALLWLSMGATLGMMLGAMLKGGANYSRGFDAGFAAGAEAALGGPLDDREVIPAEGSPFVQDYPAARAVIEYADGTRREVRTGSGTY